MRRVGFAAAVSGLALAIVVAWASADRPLVQMYPTADRLPANLLRLYLVFDRAMSTGESRAHLTLVDDTNRPVEGAFLELDDELWDATGTRLTVLFDPGRIKRGLRANLESGAPLTEGRRYTLVIDADWRDAAGRPLGVSSSKTFEVVAADRTSPDVEGWSLDVPTANTRDPLAVRFPEILDRALLSSSIGVVDGYGVPMKGSISVGPEERSWTFTPERTWRAGEYHLRVSTELEDTAGNNLRRVFDADNNGVRAIAGSAQPAHVRQFTLTTP